ncbi:MAG: tetratricopeptide repeat protein [Saprospiraceae bacterium]
MRTFLFALLFSVPFLVSGQTAKLAQRYFYDGEYEKAAELYKKLSQENTRNDYYFDRYTDCLLQLEDYATAEKVISRQIKVYPENVRLYVTYGKLKEAQFEDEAAKEYYNKAISRLSGNRNQIIRLANVFSTNSKYDLAIETFLKGATLLKDKEIFAYNLGELYRRKGETEKMIGQYLNSLAANPERMGTLRTIFQRYLSDEDFEVLQKQLYERIQEKRNALYYPELLTWVFIQRKDYKSAFRQVRALDRRMKENGMRIFQLAEIAANDGDYEAAITAYDYIVEEKGTTSSFYLDAKRESLRCRRSRLTEGYDFEKADLLELEQMYDTFLAEFGKSKATGQIIIEFAELEALYLNNLDKAIVLLEELIAYPDLNLYVKSNAKLDLADFYLIKGEIWEATLLYSQVDKLFKDDLLGHEARYRNARLSYFNGDFEWAQSQFEILKASTSKLIANDALDLSVFIMDNIGLDTTTQAMQLYAQAELLVFQNKYDQAFAKLDTLKTGFPMHSLQDDVAFLKAVIYKKQRNYVEAANYFQLIVDNHQEEIRADNALYELAQLYENQLNDKEKAMELYERLFVDFNSSILAVDARKRFRELRGDNI